MIFMNLAVQSSSRFDGRRSASLHAQQRGVSPPYVYRGIHVGMRRETAVQAVEARLALAASLIDSSAFRTGLRGVGGRHLDQCSASLLQLVGKDGFECGPALVQDRSVEAALASAGRRQIYDLQILQDDRSEPLCDAQRGSVVPVAANAGSLGGKLCATLKLSQEALGALLAPREDLLRSPMAPINRIEARRDRKHLARRKCQGISHAAVNADARQIVGWREVVNLAGERDVPAERVKAHGRRFDHTDGGACVPELDRTYLGNRHAGPLGIQALDGGFAALEPEAFVDALSARGRKAGAPLEEVAIGPIKVSQRLFLCHAGNGRNPIKLRSERGQLAALRCKTDMLAGFTEILPPEIAALLISQIVDEPAHAGELAESRFLRCGWGKPVAEAAENHGQNLAQKSRSTKP